MPNIRALAQPAGLTSGVIIARPLLAIGGFVRNQLSNALSQAEIRAFRTNTDVLTGRTISDILGRYTVSTPDGLTYYIVAHQAGTIDSMSITADNQSVTIDRIASIQSATPKSLLGVS